MNMKKYVFRNSDDLTNGCGVLVGNFFITAAHLLEVRTFILQIAGETFKLKKEDAIVWENRQAEDGGDIAVFRLDKCCSPLELDDEMPQTGMLLESFSYDHRTEGCFDPKNIFAKEQKEWFEEVSCSAGINAVAGNFFQCHTSVVLKQGSCGSPVFRNGKVFGILHGGHPGEPTCVFLSSAAILEKLHRAGIR